ncbi:hypothetical protein OG206_07405 [Streptomyces sp. NBC_01341]|nr:hypothetical protein OG206_07405 [Streptomyces sp. NBC_01341]
MVNLFVPRRLVLDIGRANSPAWGQKRDTAPVNLWWAALIAHAVVSTLAAPVGLLVMSEALMIAAAVLLGLIIERITALQTAELAATPPVAPSRPGMRQLL